MKTILLLLLIGLSFMVYRTACRFPEQLKRRLMTNGDEGLPSGGYFH